MCNRDEFEMQARRLGLNPDTRLHLFWQAARAQGGEAVAGYVSKGSLQMVADGERCPLAAIYPEPTRHINVPIYTYPQPAQHGSVPEVYACPRCNTLMTSTDQEFPRFSAEAFADTTPQPEDGWIKCSERLPTEADADCDDQVWVHESGPDQEIYQWDWHEVADCPVITHWMATGLKRPNPPAEGAE